MQAKLNEIIAIPSRGRKDGVGDAEGGSDEGGGLGGGGKGVTAGLDGLGQVFFPE